MTTKSKHIMTTPKQDLEDLKDIAAAGYYVRDLSRALVEANEVIVAGKASNPDSWSRLLAEIERTAAGVKRHVDDVLATNRKTS